MQQKLLYEKLTTVRGDIKYFFIEVDCEKSSPIV